MKKILVKYRKNFEVENLANSNSIAAIGNFDGLHIGHQKLFKLVVKDLKKAIKRLNASSSLELVAEDLKNARSHLDEVVGIKFSDSLLGDIFESFCIGK